VFQYNTLSLFRHASIVHTGSRSAPDLFSSEDEDDFLDGRCHTERSSLADSLLEPVIKG